MSVQKFILNFDNIINCFFILFTLKFLIVKYIHCIKPNEYFDLSKKNTFLTKIIQKTNKRINYLPIHQKAL